MLYIIVTNITKHDISQYQHIIVYFKPYIFRTNRLILINQVVLESPK